ncbi:MAG: N-acetylmuramoyl-L-alanine amidase [Saprospiraceae bacterium]|nr:N-acetylmuramoyl-L-alanine amidase [Saprospiraceae bacterium]MDW8229312.1 N-acetylmuramoyl-L-alanine amidase [Saprospiraceae bacterium]
MQAQATSEQFLLPRLLGALILLLWLQAEAFSQPEVTAATRFRVVDARYVEAVAQPGETVPDLLARFGLDGYTCNATEFFRINSLKEDYRLKAKTTYRLPIQIVDYDGKTVRSTLGIDSWQIASNIVEFNKQALAKGLRDRSFLDDKELWVPWHELHCRDEQPAAAAASVAPPALAGEMKKEAAAAAAAKRIFPIFGAEYQHVPLLSQRFKGEVFYIISGHGGPDVGAEGRREGHTLCEDEYAYDVSLRLARLLISHGATAYMIVRDNNDGIRNDAFLPCDKDEVIWGDQPIAYDQKERLLQRTNLVNQLAEAHQKSGAKKQTLVEIHVDSRHQTQEIDVFFYYRPGCEQSKALAINMQRVMQVKYSRYRAHKNYKGSVTARGLLTLRETQIPIGVYIELGNIRNSWDQRRLIKPRNRQLLAEWLFEAF